ncbi:MAG: ATP-binding protein [Candidatus Cloacimonadota bacterium]|nr:ATP-binding protein [Candidatus Cloacimonadota bacterium]
MKIAIASGKGGTGKTTLATNLAALIAEQQPVTLIDLDVEEPNSGLFFQGKLMEEIPVHKMVPNWEKKKCTFCGICQKVCNFNAVIQLPTQVLVFSKLCHSCYACSELCSTNALPMKPEKIGKTSKFQTGNITFIESSLDIGQEMAVPVIAHTNKILENEYNDKFIIIDAPPGTSCPVIESVKDVDFVILVAEPTPFGVHDLKLAVETMRELKKEFVVVINRFGLGDGKILDYCEQESIEILAKIPNSRAAAECYSYGKLMYKYLPEIKHEINKIAKYIWQHLGDRK